jgi:hypothetical protein
LASSALEGENFWKHSTVDIFALLCLGAAQPGWCGSSLVLVQGSLCASSVLQRIPDKKIAIKDMDRLLCMENKWLGILQIADLRRWYNDKDFPCI